MLCPRLWSLNCDHVCPPQKTILERIHSSLRVDHAHFVKLLDHFQHNSQLCLVYEMLSLDFFNVFKLRKLKPLNLSEIRPIAKQVDYLPLFQVTFWW